MAFINSPKLLGGMVIILILVVIAAAWKTITPETSNVYIEDVNCLDTIFYDGGYDGAEQHCRTFLNLNPVCIEAFAKYDDREYNFSSELECRAFVKQQSNCENNDELLKQMGIKCP